MPTGTPFQKGLQDNVSLNLEAWPKAARPVAPNEEMERRIESLLSGMTPEQKIGQIIQADIASVTPEDVAAYHLGAVLNGGNSAPGGNARAAPREWLALADAFWEASMREGGPGIPILWGTDAVHGHNNLTGATIFPHNINLGATRDPGLIERIGAATAAEVRATGMDWTFAPTLAVTRDDRWGRSYESYAENPALVAQMGAAMVRGLQGRVETDEFLGPGRVIATAKHFIGDGGTKDGHDQGETLGGETEMRAIHAAGYYAALEEGALCVMASFSSWKGRKMHGHADFLTGLLKEHWGFDGLVVGDWNGHGQIPGTSTTDCPDALMAGLDMYMAPDSWKGLRNSLLRQLRKGEVSADRLDDAVRRVLRLKFRAGLFGQPKPSQRPLAGEFGRLGCEEHVEIAGEAVRKSAVLLKNAGATLPANPKARILVTGKGADDLGMMCGGWTLSWQGEGLRKTDYPQAETLLQGIQRIVQGAGGKVEVSQDAQYDQRPDFAVYVFGEQPYAEFRGDLRTLAFSPGDTTDLENIRRLKENGIPVVAVFLSGRPLWVNPHLNASNAFIAAFLPGTQAGALADLLFSGPDGTPQLDFTGRLPFSWPEHADQYLLNHGDADYRPLFPYGFGLSLTDDGTLKHLHETSIATEPDHRIIFEQGAPRGGWKLMLADAEGLTPWAGGRAASPSAALHIRPADLGQQENAICASWAARSHAALSFVHAPVDLRREANGEFFLKLVMASTERSFSKLMLSCISANGRTGIGCFSHLPCQETPETLVLTLPLKSIAAAGADLATLRAFEIWSEEGGELTLSHISISSLERPA